MTENINALLVLWKEEWEQARHHENQRTQMANIVLLVSSAIIGFVAQQGLRPDMLPLTITLIFLGTFGFVASSKFYERVRAHGAKGNEVEQRLINLLPKIDLAAARLAALNRHRADFPRLSRLHHYHL